MGKKPLLKLSQLDLARNIRDGDLPTIAALLEHHESIPSSKLNNQLLQEVLESLLSPFDSSECDASDASAAIAAEASAPSGSSITDLDVMCTRVSNGAIACF